MLTDHLLNVYVHMTVTLLCCFQSVQEIGSILTPQMWESVSFIDCIVVGPHMRVGTA